MRLGRVRVVTALLALSLSWAAGWVVAFHLASDDHHGHGAREHAAQGLEAAIHGHLHAAGTPAHTHALVGSVVTPLPGRLALLGPTMIGAAQAVVPAVALPEHRLSPITWPNHDPPRTTSVFVLRI
jgi:hypothetical protein